MAKSLPLAAPAAGDGAGEMNETDRLPLGVAALGMFTASALLWALILGGIGWALNLW